MIYQRVKTNNPKIINIEESKMDTTKQLNYKKYKSLHIAKTNLCLYVAYTYKTDFGFDN